jgi:Aerobic-type carbon monoxide dehydrogenase, small subunit CoxS/CutS homologs
MFRSYVPCGTHIRPVALLAIVAFPETIARSRPVAILWEPSGFTAVRIRSDGFCTNRRTPLSASDNSALPDEVAVNFTLNGEARQLNIQPWTTLLDLLRLDLGLTGTKKGCDHGQCGACTVLIDGRRVNSCLQLAVMQDGHEITTIEGLAQDGRIHPLQASFIEHDAFQCGYCTPGQIMSAVALLGEGRARTRDEIREYMSGNICRCGAYPNIVDAIEAVLAQGTASREAAE